MYIPSLLGGCADLKPLLQHAKPECEAPVSRRAFSLIPPPPAPTLPPSAPAGHRVCTLHWCGTQNWALAPSLINICWTGFSVQGWKWIRIHDTVAYCPGYCDSPFLDYPGEFQLLKFYPLIRPFARICDRQCSLAFGLESRVTILLKRGRNGDKMSCLSLSYTLLGLSLSYTLLGVTISLHLSASVGKIVTEMPISTTEMGKNTWMCFEYWIKNNVIETQSPLLGLPTF